MVARAVSGIHHERVAVALATATMKCANLKVGLASRREIGIALGIIMDRHKLSADQTFDLLRRISQRVHRKVRDIALDIAESGETERPDSVALVSPAEGVTQHRLASADSLAGS
jgi:AmiR/NasT family two-component response regulator